MAIFRREEDGFFKGVLLLPHPCVRGSGRRGFTGYIPCTRVLTLCSPAWSREPHTWSTLRGGFQSPHTLLPAESKTATSREHCRGCLQESDDLGRGQRSPMPSSKCSLLYPCHMHKWGLILLELSLSHLSRSTCGWPLLFGASLSARRYTASCVKAYAHVSKEEDMFDPYQLAMDTHPSS